MMAQRMERERMSSEEKMALMTAVLNHAGLSIQGQSKIEKMLFDEQMDMDFMTASRLGSCRTLGLNS